MSMTSEPGRAWSGRLVVAFVIGIVVAAAFGLFDLFRDTQAAKAEAPARAEATRVPAYDVRTANVDFGAKQDAVQQPSRR